jgi:hypothetical protein
MKNFIIKTLLHSLIITTFLSSSAFAQCPDNRGDLTSFKIFWFKFIPLISSKQKPESLLPIFKFPLEITGAAEGRTISISQETFTKYYQQIFVKTPPYHSNKFMEYINELAAYNADEHNPLEWKFDIWANEESNFFVNTFKNGCAANPHNLVYNVDFHFTWTKEGGWKITGIYMPNDFSHIKKFLRQNKVLVYEEYGESVN